MNHRAQLLAGMILLAAGTTTDAGPAQAASGPGKAAIASPHRLAAFII